MLDEQANEPWPRCPMPRGRTRCTTLQLWTQIVGKVRLALTPWLNHSWHVTLYVPARGLGTGPIAARGARSRSTSTSSTTCCGCGSATAISGS